MAASLPDKINVLHELEQAGVKWTPSGEDEVKVRCPFHGDEQPSCAVNIEKRVFHCNAAGCGVSGDFVTYLARVAKTTRALMLVDLAKRYHVDKTKTIDPSVVERAHENIWAAGPLLKELRKRAVTDAMIRRWRLGESDGRITIPICNEGDLFVNIRRYLPGAPGAEKMRNSRGHGKIRLWPPAQLEFDEIVVCGGEIKTIVAIEELNKHGIGAICATAGEGNWDPSFTPKLRGKRTWVTLDVDPEGQTAAQELCAQLHPVTKWLGNVLLPLDVDQYPHGDINDFVAAGGQLLPLLRTCPQWEPRARIGALTDDPPRDVELHQAMHARMTATRVRVGAVVAAMDTAPYIIPSKVRVHCDRAQKECALCAVYPSTSTEEFEIPSESAAILEMVASPKSFQHDAMARGVGVPVSCRSVQFDPLSYYNVEDARVSPRLEITSQASDRVMQPALCIGQKGGLELNEAYQLVGRMWPHPKTQQSTLLVSHYEPTQDALSTYEPRDLEELEMFRPEEWTAESIGVRLGQLYEDLEANVTRIFRRREMHLLIDLVYHSPLVLTFDGRDNVKGWVEALILGDSSQGKSETMLCMMKHYGLGEKAECKNASVAGLLGGVAKQGDRWFVTWGILPTHDRRFVWLEELKGAATEVIAKLTDARTSGVAEIDKIEKRRTHCRVRLLACSNPRSDRTMAAHNFGIEAIKELIGGLEDIRRFDAAVLVSAADIESSEINMLQNARPVVEARHTGDLCRRLILWAWTRRPEQVCFEDDATQLVLARATQMCETFTEAIPLVDRGSMRLKLARLAASLACRTFSTTPDRQTVVVRACHVEYVADWLIGVYSSRTFGYLDFTAAQRLTEKLVDEKLLIAQIAAAPHPHDLAKQLLHTSKLELVDIQDWCGWDRENAMHMLSFFVRKHALARDGRHYRKTPPFIRLLKTMLENGALPNRPDYIHTKEKEEF